MVTKRGDVLLATFLSQRADRSLCRLRMIYMQRLEALQAEIQRLENQQVEMQQRPVA